MTVEKFLNSVDTDMRISVKVTLLLLVMSMIMSN